MQLRFIDVDAKLANGFVMIERIGWTVHSLLVDRHEHVAFFAEL